MTVDLQALYKAIDDRLTSSPSLTPEDLAKELNVTVADIEYAVGTIEGIAFHKYLEYKRLTYAMKNADEKWTANANRIYEKRRIQSRLVIPGATVRYLLYGHGIRKSKFSNSYPLKDLGRGGMAFLADRPSKTGRTMSLLIDFAGIKEPLSLKGHVVYAMPVGIASHQYRIGIQFKPFAPKPGNNPPEALEIFAQLEKMAAEGGQSGSGIRRAR